MTEQVIATPESEAAHAFDAANNVEPCRTIAARIVGRYGFAEFHPLVDTISHAIEDARDLGKKRAYAEITGETK